jgi:hypothetical protein
MKNLIPKRFRKHRGKKWLQHMKLPWKSIRINFEGEGATVELSYYNGRNWKTLGLQAKYTHAVFRLESRVSSLRAAHDGSEDPTDLFVGEVESGKGLYQVRMRKSECHGTEYTDVMGLGADAWARPKDKKRGSLIQLVQKPFFDARKSVTEDEGPESGTEYEGPKDEAPESGLEDEGPKDEGPEGGGRSRKREKKAPEDEGPESGTEVLTEDEGPEDKGPEGGGRPRKREKKAREDEGLESVTEDGDTEGDSAGYGAKVARGNRRKLEENVPEDGGFESVTEDEDREDDNAASDAKAARGNDTEIAEEVESGEGPTEESDDEVYRGAPLYSDKEKEDMNTLSKGMASDGKRFTCYLEMRFLSLLSATKKDYLKYADAEREYADNPQKQEIANNADPENMAQPSQWFTYNGESGKLKLNFFLVNGSVVDGYYNIDVALPFGGVCNEGTPCPFIATDYRHFKAQFNPLDKQNPKAGAVLVLREHKYFTDSRKRNDGSHTPWFLYPIFDDLAMKGFTKDKDVEGFEMEVATKKLEISNRERPAEFENVKKAVDKGVDSQEVDSEEEEEEDEDEEDDGEEYG